MARSAVGSLLACASLLALGCGKSVSGSNDGENTGEGGSSGASTTGGASGAGETGGASGTPATGGSAGTATELEPYFEPGTRLKPLVTEAGAGLDIIEHWVDGGFHDSELDFDCYFAPDDAGVERCFPAAILAGLVYGDASCTRPVFIDLGPGSGACDGPRNEYVVLDELESESCGVSGLHLGDELPATTPLFSMEGSTCEPVTLPPTPSHVYELEAVPPETFVGMRRVRRPRAPGLDAYVREGDDGSWQVIGHFDPARDSPCFELGADLSPSLKCIPPRAASSRYFADAACEVRTAEVASTACSFETPMTMIELREDASVCPAVRPFDLYEITDSREATPYVRAASGECVVATDGEITESWIQGARIDPSTLPTLEMLLVGSGPVRGRFTGFGGVPFLPDVRGGPFFDAESGVGCKPFTISDGSLRCVPSSFVRVDPLNVYYENSSCSGARVWTWGPEPFCLTDAPLPEGAVIFGGETECSGERTLSEAFAFAGRSSASAFYVVDVNGACQPVGDLATSVTPLVLGEALDPARIFAPLVRTIRE